MQARLRIIGYTIALAAYATAMLVSALAARAIVGRP